MCHKLAINCLAKTGVSSESWAKEKLAFKTKGCRFSLVAGQRPSTISVWLYILSLPPDKPPQYDLFLHQGKQGRQSASKIEIHFYQMLSLKMHLVTFAAFPLVRKKPQVTLTLKRWGLSNGINIRKQGHWSHFSSTLISHFLLEYWTLLAFREFVCALFSVSNVLLLFLFIVSFSLTTQCKSHPFRYILDDHEHSLCGPIHAVLLFTTSSCE